MTRQTISVVMLTKNYEHKIRPALESASWADEIIIFDGFSTDKTLDICREFTDKIYQSPWSGSFGTERNRATEKATKDWCLHMDPDERITPEFKEIVLRILSVPTDFDAFEFHKKNYFFGHWMKRGGWYHYSLHFFRRGKAFYEGKIHENLKVDGKVGRIEEAIEHYPFDSISEFIKRHNRYSSLEAEEERLKHERLSDRQMDYEIRRKPVKRFFKFFFKKQGYLEGKYGFIFSVLFAWVHFLNWAKYWELLEKDAAK